MAQLSLEILTLIENKDSRVLYLATLNNGKYQVVTFEKLSTVIKVNGHRLDIIFKNIKKPLMAFANCKERGVAELSMDLIGDLLKKIFSFQKDATSTSRINELVQNALELFKDLVELGSEKIIELTVNKILKVIQQFGLTLEESTWLSLYEILLKASDFSIQKQNKNTLMLHKILDYNNNQYISKFSDSV
jgi:hypothetical protein